MSFPCVVDVYLCIASIRGLIRLSVCLDRLHVGFNVVAAFLACSYWFNCFRVSLFFANGVFLGGGAPIRNIPSLRSFVVLALGCDVATARQ